MADIDIVPKQRSSYLWLWIILALVVLAVLWYVLSRDDTPAVGALGEVLPALVAQAAPVVGWLG